MTTDNKYFSINDFRQFMTDPVIPIQDINDFEGKPIYQSFPFWRRKELLPFFPKGEWQNVRISSMQYMWIRILLTFRAIGFSVTKIQKVCDYFFKDAYFQELPKLNMLANKEALIKKQIAGTISLEEVDTLKIIESVLDDVTIQHALKFTINYLTQLVYDTLNTNEESGILVFTDGTVVEHIGNHYFNHNNSKFDIDAPHLYLPLKHFLRELINDNELQSLIVPQLLNDDEKYVVKQLRNKNIRALKISLRSGKVVRVESEKEKIISGKKAKEIMEYLGLRNYENVELITLDDKTLKFKKTIKKINSV